MEKLLWSIALPGFGQLLNKKYFKGLLLIVLELIVNVQSNFNEVLILSFHGNMESAVETADYQWLMFYPCLYLFSAWDAYRDGSMKRTRYSYLPFVLAAYMVTVGLIYSSTFKIFGVLLGPVWLPMLGCMIGAIVGLIIQKMVIRGLAAKQAE